MKPIFALFAAVALVVAAAGVGVALAARSGHGHGHGQGSTRHGGAIHVIEHATTDLVTNPGEGAGTDHVGDVLTFTNQVFDEADKNTVGHDQGYCVRIIVGESWECIWTTFLDRGQITVEGPFYDTKDSVVAITGGTGAYARVRGSMDLHARAGGTEFDFIFHLNH
jgi:allene oxide cyclase